MENLLLFRVDDTPVVIGELDRIFRSVPGFDEIRYETPSGTPIEAKFNFAGDYTRARLSSTHDAISISGTSIAALQAALVIQQSLPFPLRIINTGYTFDLNLQDFQNVRDLEAAIDAAHGI